MQEIVEHRESGAEENNAKERTPCEEDDHDWNSYYVLLNDERDFCHTCGLKGSLDREEGA